MGSLAPTDQRKVVIITGATSGIGRDLAHRLHARGYNVAITGRRIKEGEAIAAELDASGKTVLFAECHVESYASQLQLFKAVWAKWSRIDAFIANAGMVDSGSRYNLARRGASVNEPPPEPDVSCTDVDFKAVVYTTELFVHYMRHNPPGVKGKIIVTGSIIAIYPCPTFPEYSAVKAAALQWVRVMAPMLLKHEGVTINTVLPNAYDTGIMPDFKEAYLDEHMTQKECLMSAYDVFLEDETNLKTGQAIETAYESHYGHEVPAYKSGNVIERTDKVYEPWFQYLHHGRSGLDGAYLEPLRKSS
ncbi:hypothetical protein JX266_009192 [Neoarthrinium moseri]|uniref:uncharacterized protein n=1 Tax=Neoarthrinium moseri TaxID=1658444 RepID=UPI001FDD2DC8|nr:uncharacterized protein JN550_007955 [Neoarthrinium moseri]KAI1844736.1 hypothetical protein JX266_009192 [Neoarthrinium moseri]KAI1865977.1 hypothetical protein JN550_007955 [Neoarthrinium moseri]